MCLCVYFYRARGDRSPSAEQTGENKVKESKDKDAVKGANNKVSSSSNANRGRDRDRRRAGASSSSDSSDR